MEKIMVVISNFSWWFLMMSTGHDFKKRGSTICQDWGHLLKGGEVPSTLYLTGVWKGGSYCSCFMVVSTLKTHVVAQSMSNRAKASIRTSPAMY